MPAKMRLGHMFQCFSSHDSSKPQGRDIYSLSKKKQKKNLLDNGQELLKERICLFNGRTNPIRCFSVDELISMIDYHNVDHLRVNNNIFDKGVWDGRLVLVKSFYRKGEAACREIAVAAEMSTHNNVHKLIGCCLETECPVLVFDWVDPAATLYDRVINTNMPDMKLLEWKDRLRVAWEISHAVSYLHTAFRRPIIHRDLKPENVFLDEDNVAKLTDFSLCISIPEGEEFVEDNIAGTVGYLSPEYFRTYQVAPSSDVYSFGVLLLVLLTGQRAFSFNGETK